MITAAGGSRGDRLPVLVVASLTFFAAGISQATLGPALPDLARATGADLAALGAVFAALYGGGLAAQLVTGAIVDRVGHRPVLVAGPALAGLGVLGIALGPSLPVVLAAGVVWGLGYGALVVGANLVVADAYMDGGAGALNLTNVFFGVGAVTGPAIVGVLLAAGGSAVPALWAAAGTMALTAGAAFLLRPPAHGRHATHRAAGTAPVDRAAARRLLGAPIAWVFGAVLLLYVASEGSVGAWLATYLLESAGTPRDAGALATSGFWLALTVGRLLAAIASRRLAAPSLLLASLGGTLAGGIGLVVASGSAPATVAAALLLGVSLGPVYPTTIALVAVRFPVGTGTVAGVVMTLGSLGGTVGPWLCGLLILRVSPLVGFAMVPLAATAMLALWVVARHLGWRSPTAPARV